MTIVVTFRWSAVSVRSWEAKADAENTPFIGVFLFVHQG